MRQTRWILVGMVATLAGCPVPVDALKSAGPAAGSVKLSALKTPSLPGKTVAKIGDTVLTVGDLQEKLGAETPFAQARLRDPAEMKKWVNAQVKWEALAQEAFRRGYHQDPEAIDTLKKMVVQRISREEYERGVKVSDVGQVEMQTYFREHEDEYNKPEMVRVSVVKIAKRNDPTNAKKIATKAHKVAANPATLEERRVFKELVKIHSSDDESRAREGDAQYMGVKDLEKRFTKKGVDAIMTTSKLNEVAPLVETDDAYWIFKRTGRRKPITRTFDDVKSQIRNKLYREKKSKAFEEWVAQLKKDFGASVDESAIAELKVHGGQRPAPASAPAP